MADYDGGLLLGGGEEAAETYNEVGSGGVVAAGSCGLFLIATRIATGGAVCNSTASVSLVLSTSGGTVASGTALLSYVAAHVISGGVKAGSSAVLNSFIELGSGGAVCSGTATNTLRIRTTATGGSVVSGLSISASSIPISGGSVCGGSATVERFLNVVASGGSVAGYNWKIRPITVTVASTLQDFVFVCQDDFDDLDNEDSLYILDANGNSKPHRVRNWDGEKLHLDIRATLEAGENNFYVYYEVVT